MKTLICLLGMSPGIATGAYYALKRADITVDQVVTLSTNADKANDVERVIGEHLEGLGLAYRRHPVCVLPVPDAAEELTDYRQRLKACVTTDAYGASFDPPPSRLRIAAEDISDAPSLTAMREVLRLLVTEQYARPEDEVYLCAAGGRKSMAALAMLAAELGPRVKRLFHLHVPRHIEEDGSVESQEWSRIVNAPDRLRAILRPPDDELQLVDIPFFRFQPGDQGLELFIGAERLDDFVLDLLIQRDGLVLLEGETERRVYTAFFEVAVAQYLQTHCGYQAVRRNPNEDWFKRNFGQVKRPPALNDPKKPAQVDVAAVAADHLLLVECKCYERTDKPIEMKHITQAINFLKTEMPDGRPLQVWLCTNTTVIGDDSSRLPEVTSGRLKIMSTAPTMHFRKLNDPKKWTADLDKEDSITKLTCLNPTAPSAVEG